MQIHLSVTFTLSSMQILLIECRKREGRCVDQGLCLYSRCGRIMGELQFRILLLASFWSWCHCAGLQLKGDFTIYGMFPLHNTGQSIPAAPCMAECKL